MQFLKCAVAILLAAPIFGSDGNPQSPQGLTVHEWGTFTTVADESGGAQAWSPLAGPSDLPCFVAHLHGVQYKMMIPTATPTTTPTQTVTVRMETPVLYFYSPRKTTVSVGVDFPKGLITEWYPNASRVSPEPATTLPPVEHGHIEWNSFEITPGEKPWLPHGAGASHYYAARETDADPVSVFLGRDQEKFLFYRGIANFAVPLQARVTDANQVELRNTGDGALALAILFENRGGRIGYRITRGLNGSEHLDAPELTGSLDRLKQDLANNLVALGLYPKEAAAMIETWRDSWFEEGMRVFYLVPRGLVDRELPLSIKPAPAVTERIFVGRVELLSPFMRDRLATALSTGDLQTLDRFGRFLAPFLQQVKVTAAPAVAGYLAAKAAEARQEFYSPSCVR
jgi:hypothetical protein